MVNLTKPSWFSVINVHLCVYSSKCHSFTFWTHQPSICYFSFCSFSCPYPDPWILQFDFSFYIHLHQTLSLHMAQHHCHPLYPFFHSSPSSFLAFISCFLLPTHSICSMGSHVTSLKLSPINQQHLGGYVSVQVSDWFLHLDLCTHTERHSADPRFLLPGTNVMLCVRKNGFKLMCVHMEQIYLNKGSIKRTVINLFIISQ